MKAILFGFWLGKICPKLTSVAVLPLSLFFSSPKSHCIVAYLSCRSFLFFLVSCQHSMATEQCGSAHGNWTRATRACLTLTIRPSGLAHECNTLRFKLYHHISFLNLIQPSMKASTKERYVYLAFKPVFSPDKLRNQFITKGGCNVTFVKMSSLDTLLYIFQHMENSGLDNKKQGQPTLMWGACSLCWPPLQTVLRQQHAGKGSPLIVFLSFETTRDNLSIGVNRKDKWDGRIPTITWLIQTKQRIHVCFWKKNQRWRRERWPKRPSLPLSVLKSLAACSHSPFQSLSTWGLMPSQFFVWCNKNYINTPFIFELRIKTLLLHI